MMKYSNGISMEIYRSTTFTSAINGFRSSTNANDGGSTSPTNTVHAMVVLHHQSIRSMPSFSFTYIPF